MDLTIEKRVQESLTGVREKARKEADEQLSLKVMEKEQTILSMQKQIEELKRKAEQGSQQLQGEVLELRLEALLGEKFQRDLIEPFQGGTWRRYFAPSHDATGVACGTILWESKRTKNWSDGWLRNCGKINALQSRGRSHCERCAPKAVETFDQIDGVWIAHPRAILPVALALRKR